MDVFKIIPENFFSVLSCRNQELYVRCLTAVFQAYEQGSVLGMDKQIAQQAIVDVLEQSVGTGDIEGLEPGTSVREKANTILRRFEECEWIDVDVNNDYVEIMNFRDYAITVMQALKSVATDSMYGYEDETHEFRGYIYTAYTLLENEKSEFAMVVDQVYKNTVAFIREIRKLDSRLKSTSGRSSRTPRSAT